MLALPGNKRIRRQPWPRLLEIQCSQSALFELPCGEQREGPWRTGWRQVACQDLGAKPSVPDAAKFTEEVVPSRRLAFLACPSSSRTKTGLTLRRESTACTDNVWRIWITMSSTSLSRLLVVAYVAVGELWVAPESAMRAACCNIQVHEHENQRIHTIWSCANYIPRTAQQVCMRLVSVRGNQGWCSRERSYATDNYAL